MEYLDLERKKLLEASERHKQALAKDFDDITLNTNKYLKNALIIGGSLTLTYMALNQLTKSSKKIKKTNIKEAAVVDASTEMEEHEPSLLSQLGAKLVDQATLILLDLAKEKLSEYLQSKKSEDIK
jgi:arginine exporter protein ArgO